jgi:hypothetical protein
MILDLRDDRIFSRARIAPIHSVAHPRSKGSSIQANGCMATVFAAVGQCTAEIVPIAAMANAAARIEAPKSRAKT